MLVDVPLDQIIPSPYQGRQTYDVKGLADSIRKDGVQQPPKGRPVRPDSTSLDRGADLGDLESLLRGGEHIQLAYGHRRWKAKCLIAREDGVDLSNRTITVDVERLTDRQMYRFGAQENAEREDESAIAQARRIEEGYDTGYTYEDISEDFGKSKSWVAARHRLINLPPAHQERVGDDLPITAASEAAKLWDLSDEQAEIVEQKEIALEAARDEAIRRAREENLSDTREYVRAVLSEPTTEDNDGGAEEEDVSSGESGDAGDAPTGNRPDGGRQNGSALDGEDDTAPTTDAGGDDRAPGPRASSESRVDLSGAEHIFDALSARRPAALRSVAGRLPDPTPPDSGRYLTDEDLELSRGDALDLLWTLSVRLSALIGRRPKAYAQNGEPQ